jgi:hypothetical protein
MNARGNWLAAGWLALSSLPPTVTTTGLPKNTLGLRLNAGETYVIDGLKRGATVGIKIVNNHNALVVNSQMPGSIVLVGAEEGKWAITVERSDGHKVTYQVTVVSVGRPFSDPLTPGRIPSVTGSAIPGGFSSEPKAERPNISAPKTIEVNP